MKIHVLFFVIVVSVVILGCSGKQTVATTAPIADPEMAVLEMENPNFGPIKIELYSNIAPKMVQQFKDLAKEGVYDGTAFHRINETVVQGGDPLSKDNDPSNDGTGGSDKPDVSAEFSSVPFDTAIVGAARSQDINSANSQFFIMLKREPGFDNKYTVFGKVIEGMDEVFKISKVQPKRGERPLWPVKIKHVSIVPRDQAK
ncbi:MAG TPA: peptidylprolyl isomerase [Pyrinomonadaceae bacterium]